MPGVLCAARPVWEGELAVVFWFCVGVVFYVYVGYPLLIGLAATLRGKKVRRGEHTPTVTLLICAYNEEKVIGRKIENALSLDYPKEKLEVIVASESSDGTNSVVREFQDRGVRLLAWSQRQGKVPMLRKAFPHTSGEIIVFSDANAMYDRGAIRNLMRNFADERVGAVSGELRYHDAQGSSIGTSEGLYWRYEQMVKRQESKIFSLLGANGSIFALRRELYDPISDERGDDFELPIRVIQRGFGAVLDPEAVSLEESSSTSAEEYQRKVRIVAWMVRSAFILLRESLQNRQWRLAFQLISHKILRWSIPIFLVGVFVSSFFLRELGYRVFFLVEWLFLALALVPLFVEGKRIALPLFVRIPHYFCMVNVAAAVGIWHGAFGRRGGLWEKVRA